jgi:CRISPR-associated protein Cmr4
MPYQFKMLFYRTITPLNIGCGQDVGVVDLPIIRERTTGYPYMPGSSIRGVFRDIYEGVNKDMAIKIFGNDSNDITAGCVSIIDAHILFFPVRANTNVFAWITCPYIISRFNSESQYFLSNGTSITVPTKTNCPGDEQYSGPDLGDIYLEEYKFSRKDNYTLDNFNGFGELPPNILLVSDKTFFQFVNQATLVAQHNKLTSAKTVSNTALFSIESLPPETLFYGFVGATKERSGSGDSLNAEKVIENITKTITDNKPVFFGGHESIGMGLTKLFWK